MDEKNNFGDPDAFLAKIESQKSIKDEKMVKKINQDGTEIINYPFLWHIFSIILVTRMQAPRVRNSMIELGDK